MDSETKFSAVESLLKIDWPKALSEALPTAMLTGMLTGMLMGGLLMLVSEHYRVLGAASLGSTLATMWIQLWQKLDRIQSKLTN
jgi:hypothetical protein